VEGEVGDQGDECAQAARDQRGGEGQSDRSDAEEDNAEVNERWAGRNVLGLEGWAKGDGDGQAIGGCGAFDLMVSHVCVVRVSCASRQGTNCEAS